MDSPPHIHWLDVVVAIALLAGLLLGAAAGLKRILFRLLHYAAAIAISVYLYRTVRAFVSTGGGASDSIFVDAATGAALFLAAYLLLLFCAWLALRMFRELIGRPASEQLDRGIYRSGLKPLDRLLGGIFGVLLAALPVLGLMLVMYLQPSTDDGGKPNARPYAFAAVDATVASIPAEHQERLARLFEQSKQRALRQVAAKWSSLLDDLGRQLDRQLDENRSKSKATGNDDSVAPPDANRFQTPPPALPDDGDEFTEPPPPFF